MTKKSKKKNSSQRRGEERSRMEEGGEQRSEERHKTKRAGEKRSRGKTQGRQKENKGKSREMAQRIRTERENTEGGKEQERRGGKASYSLHAHPMDVRVCTPSGGWVCL